jgi:hypothetical protein
LDWEPFEGYTTSDLIMGAQLLHTLQVVPSGDGTDLKYSVGVLEISPAKSLIFKLMTRGLFLYKKSMFAKLRERIDQDMIERGAFMTTENRISTQSVTDTAANHFSAGD